MELIGSNAADAMFEQTKDPRSFPISPVDAAALKESVKAEIYLDKELALSQVCQRSPSPSLSHGLIRWPFATLSKVTQTVTGKLVTLKVTVAASFARPHPHNAIRSKLHYENVLL